MDANHIKKLGMLGQSVWLDYICRDLIVNGELQHLINEDGIKGITSNPTILEKAITNSHDYDDDIKSMVLKGGDVNKMMAELFAKSTGYCKAKGGSMHICDLNLGIMGSNGIVGAGLSIAAGVGVAAKMRDAGQVCVCFFGDGASNRGTFHESANMASSFKLPVIFVCENNFYGIFTISQKTFRHS